MQDSFFFFSLRMNKCLERVNDRHFWNPRVLSYAMIPRYRPNSRLFFFFHRRIYSLCTIQYSTATSTLCSSGDKDYWGQYHLSPRPVSVNYTLLQTPAIINLIATFTRASFTMTSIWVEPSGTVNLLCPIILDVRFRPGAKVGVTVTATSTLACPPIQRTKPGHRSNTPLATEPRSSYISPVPSFFKLYVLAVSRLDAASSDSWPG